ncbi:MAG: hypothetical protein AAFY11_08540, partial [Cyanobacteria bacterium J06641_5]
MGSDFSLPHMTSVAATLPPVTRQHLAVQMLAQSQPVTQLAEEHEVSRPFLYRQKTIAEKALEPAFALPKKQDESEVLFHLPVTHAWLQQLILGLILICHSSYRGVVELLRDLFDWSISVGTIHNRVRSATEDATTINASEDLSGIRVGLHDEIFQGEFPVLAGVCAFSTYCYLLVSAQQRDGETWGWHLLEAEERGLAPDYTIADGSKGLRAGQELAWPGVPCQGDVFHILRDCKDLAGYLTRKARAAQSKREKLEKKMATAKQKGKGRKLSKPLTLAYQREKEAHRLVSDVKTLLDWLQHDVFALAGPESGVRQELLAFIIDELRWREAQSHRIATLRRALQKQGAQLLAFARVLDGKLTEIARNFDVSPYLVRPICVATSKP